MPLNSKSPKILILDTHNGAAMFLHALFGEMGMEAEVLSDMIIHGNPKYSPFGASPFHSVSGLGAVKALSAPSASCLIWRFSYCAIQSRSCATAAIIGMGVCGGRA